MAMTYLCDTNVLLEIVLKRQEALSCAKFISDHYRSIALTDFGLFSFCIHVERHRQELSGFSFIQDLFRSGVEILPTEPWQAIQMLFDKTLTRLDYDDFIQYQAAKKRKLTLVTLDKDFFKHKLDILVLRPDQVK